MIHISYSLLDHLSNNPISKQHCRSVAEFCSADQMITTSMHGIHWKQPQLVNNYSPNSLACEINQSIFYRFSKWPWKSRDITYYCTKWHCFGFIFVGSICSRMGLISHSQAQTQQLTLFNFLKNNTSICLTLYFGVPEYNTFEKFKFNKFNSNTTNCLFIWNDLNDLYYPNSVYLFQTICMCVSDHDHDEQKYWDLTVCACVGNFILYLFSMISELSTVCTKLRLEARKEVFFYKKRRFFQFRFRKWWRNNIYFICEPWERMTNCVHSEFYFGFMHLHWFVFTMVHVWLNSHWYYETPVNLINIARFLVSSLVIYMFHRFSNYLYQFFSVIWRYYKANNGSTSTTRQFIIGPKGSTYDRSATTNCRCQCTGTSYSK